MSACEGEDGPNITKTENQEYNSMEENKVVEPVQ